MLLGLERLQEHRADAQRRSFQDLLDVQAGDQQQGRDLFPLELQAPDQGVPGPLPAVPVHQHQGGAVTLQLPRQRLEVREGRDFHVQQGQPPGQSFPEQQGARQYGQPGDLRLAKGPRNGFQQVGAHGFLLPTA